MRIFVLAGASLLGWKSNDFGGLRFDTKPYDYESDRRAWDSSNVVTNEAEIRISNLRV